MKIGRQTLTDAVDPVTPSDLVNQYEALKNLMGNRLIDDENFYGSGYKFITDISDAMSSNKYFIGNYVSTETETAGESCYDLMSSFNDMIQMLDEEYIVYNKTFEFKLTAEGCEYRETGLSGGDVASGLLQVGSGVATGAAIGSAIPGVGTAIGSAVGGGVGLLGTFISWSDNDNKKEVGQEIRIRDRLPIQIPFGYEYVKHTLSGTMTAAEIDTDEYIIPIVKITGSTTDQLNFIVSSQHKVAFDSTKFYHYLGNIQVLLKRKL